MALSQVGRATIDFEVRSACNLKQAGSWRYSLDPTTEPLCLAFRLPHWEPGRVELWHPAFPHLGIPESDFRPLFALLDWIRDGGLVEAHNAWFERGIWTNVMGPQFGWPDVPGDQWRCSAAKTAAHSLPRGLDDAAAALLLPVRKDAEGHDLMRKMTSPRTPTKADVQGWLNAHDSGPCPKCKGRGTWRRKPCERCGAKGALPVPEAEVPPLPLLWHESPELLERLFAYCRQDVLTEEAVSAVVPDLSPAETDLYLLDQTINARGFQLDEAAVERALELVAMETVTLNAEIADLTGGYVTAGTQRQRMLDWFASEGLLLENTQAQTIDETLKDPDLKPEVQRGLSLMRELGRSSTAKYTTMQRWMCPDGRVRGGLLYHGAGTGRWSGAGVQPQNFVRGGAVKLTQDEIWHLLKTAERADLLDAYGSVMLVLSEALRGAICAAPGHTLYVADYASIEARVLLWLAECESGLDLFRRGEDIYCSMASDIYHRPITKADKQERQLGKAAVLGCGYQMGGAKFVATAANYGVTITEDFSREVVAAYRLKFWEVPRLWADQEAAAMNAVRGWGKFACGPVTWHREGIYLYCTLPSGRRLAYPFPKIQPRTMSWGDVKQGLTYMGVNSYTRQWQRQHMYGGMIVENLVQAMARDIMADAMIRAEASGVYAPVLSVHDELIAEAPEGQGSVADFEALMVQTPDWAAGLPVAAEGWAATRYHK